MPDGDTLSEHGDSSLRGGGTHRTCHGRTGWGFADWSIRAATSVDSHADRPRSGLARESTTASKADSLARVAQVLGGT